MRLLRNENRSAPTAGQRGGFTMIELLVVVAIMAVLATLSLGTVVKAISYIKTSTTEKTIQKVMTRLERRLETLRSEAYAGEIGYYGMDTVSDAAIPAGSAFDLVSKPDLYTFAAGASDRERRRARVLFHKLLYKWSFPMSYEEVRMNVRIDTSTGEIKGHPFAVAMYKSLRDRIDKTTPNKNYVAANGVCKANDPFTERAACLALIYRQLGSLDELTGGELQDTDGDGLPEILDAWGTPLRFFRWPTEFYEKSSSGQPSLPLIYPIERTISVRANRDPQDSGQKLDPSQQQISNERLLDATWQDALYLNSSQFNGKNYTLFQFVFHELRHPYSPATPNNVNFQNRPLDADPLYAPLVVVSAGQDRRFGLVGSETDATMPQRVNGVLLNEGMEIDSKALPSYARGWVYEPDNIYSFRLR